MSPENDFNVSRVEQTQQIGGADAVNRRNEKRRRESGKKKGQDEEQRRRELEEAYLGGEEEQIQPEEVEQEGAEQPKIDYRA